ncbi:hypothetical protein ACIQM0_06745 [Streptomyces sp. NPDC091387]|uniref:hypothetical protein n=1 Tax=Streptomyces sp. NPDC091387 TaxID=3365998 RepID=UPI00381CDDA1
MNIPKRSRRLRAQPAGRRGRARRCHVHPVGDGLERGAEQGVLAARRELPGHGHRTAQGLPGRVGSARYGVGRVAPVDELTERAEQGHARCAADLLARFEDGRRGDEEPAAHDVSAVQALGERSGGRCRDDDTEGRHRAPHRGLERALAEDGPHVLREEGGEADGGGHRQEVDQDRTSAGAAAQEGQVDHRVGEPALAVDEDEAEDETDGDSEGGQRPVAVLGDFLDAVDHRQQRGEGEHRAQDVKPRLHRAPGLREDGIRQSGPGRRPGGAGAPGHRTLRRGVDGAERATVRSRLGRWSFLVLLNLFEHDTFELGLHVLFEFGLHRTLDGIAVMIGETSA